ncbi:Endonuclease MutS2 [Bacillus sp. THAF10]|uniref:endonuclease MutS2 n=1 Tax=Bacillus sp. THAF10 TaxID=2587848 RepID=UPI0012681F80|nr:endonuclease MutS2 [Bacillus sp. THAF10]QFT90119.1 Endonuclease MutS2 [Bacillus sp. THAF10]
MQPRVLKVLEFNKVKDKLAGFSASSLGREKVLQLMPSIDYMEVVKSQEQTDEAATVLRLKGEVPLGGITDIRAHVKRAEIGGTLNTQELLDIAGTIYAARKLDRFVETLLEEELYIPILKNYMDQLVIYPELERNIKNCIDEYGEVLDGASEKLRGIRQQLRSTESRVREKLESMIRSSNAQKMLSDSIVTIRNERYVIPVKQEYRGAYGGIVHDQSSSGATLFIEPQQVVDLNNVLQEAKVKEKLEIDRILAELSAEVAEVARDLMENVSILAEIDFMFAKAKYAKHIRATKPKINDKRIVRLVQARHPLIPGDEVVPNTIELGKDYTSIVITGPNTGGKTVTLKTLGLLQIMAQSGLQVPAQDGSEVGVFSAVYADIGDEQSIEQSLSTFSSHMVNIVDILKKVDHNSLVLFDELGAGTDPQEGAALAISILDEVYQRGACVIATTHYPELKAYGYNREGVVNASVEFNVDTLSPTYRLLIGVPGRSNAFEISKRLGLENDVIQRAKEFVSEDSNKVENMIASLEASQKRAEAEWQEAEQIRKTSEKLHEELEQQMQALDEQRDKLMEKAAEKAEKLVEQAKQEAEQVIRELRKMRMEQHAHVKEHELIDAKKRLGDAVPTVKKSASTKKQEVANQTLEPGDEVKVLSLNQKGHLVEKTGEKEWQVQIGIMKMKVKDKDIHYISRPKPVETKPLATIKGKDYHVSLELDLRGERFENALMRVEKYLDDAVLAGYHRVSIIHGKGTGALRVGVQNYLKNHRSVKNHRYGEASEGGIGVTVVELK